MLRRILESAGYEAIEAANGQEALDILNHQPISLVISDINMPLMDGLTFISELKSNPQSADIPIIIITTESETDFILKASQLGVRHYLLKPVDSRVVLEKVAYILEKKGW